MTEWNNSFCVKLLSEFQFSVVAFPFYNGNWHLVSSTHWMYNKSIIYFTFHRTVSRNERTMEKEIEQKRQVFFFMLKIMLIFPFSRLKRDQPIACKSKYIQRNSYFFQLALSSPPAHRDWKKTVQIFFVVYFPEICPCCCCHFEWLKFAIIRCKSL